MTDKATANGPDIQALVEGLARARVALAGDVMLDRFVYGEVSRISPEAPIPVLRVGDEKAMPGGAGNVARNLAALGAKVDFLSVVGDDEAGAELKTALGAEAVTSSLTVVPGRETTVKMRFVAMGQQVLRVDRETHLPLGNAPSEKFIAGLTAALDDKDVLVLSDYGKGVLTPAVLAAAITAARGKGLPVVIDPKGRDYARYAGADVVTPNRKELGEATGLPVENDEEIVAAARALIMQHGIGAVVVTRAQAGMSVVTSDGVTHLKAEAREVFDVSGAGDTVVSTLAAALGSGLPLPQAAALANSAAGIVVGKVGTAVVHGDELAAKLRERELSALEAKVAGLESARDIVEAWRARGLSVGFTNGCFDLLHPGHVTLLDKARALCDRLVVGLNSDQSVKRLKGEDRPVQPEIARATVLAALQSVDLVVIFEEDTPARLIETLRPGLLVKGGDYKVSEIVGAEFVQANGGRVEIVDIVPGFSTTGTIARLGR
ncbi:bifunctional D-glycero-beta-D-manno-heptose-7-phosphate kinase/D-glycero-beta-D-manno-heptose 1-phosphate adenylyltransferase HldE [Parvibaculum sp.]|jgi:D-beta-D-heptose 7-phosphate kinase/D-beta-D-heptose 1-phosphate adenosyltransferase|uniref:bifunctional D-glycero-beta-D-manno-heptose-7-phosphate kinase/D-glycero-beta-D-manno-heptose 1-phosphate adenylyltransferase HldE n=1 Tax=Parvibaculum sp. TaxID=2024848 RepID=UPI002FDAE062